MRWQWWWWVERKRIPYLATTFTKTWDTVSLTESQLAVRLLLALCASVLPQQHVNPYDLKHLQLYVLSGFVYMIIVPITTSLELLIMRVYVRSEETKVIHRILEKKKKITRADNHPTRQSLRVMFTVLQNQQGYKMVCVARKPMGIRRGARTISIPAHLISFIRLPFCETVP